MKKLVIASAALFLAAITNVNAQTEQQQPPVNKKEVVTTPKKIDQQTKTPINPDVLPEAVKTSLASADYAGWNVTSVLLLKAATDSYEVTLSKGKESKTVIFDQAGRPQM